MSVYKRYFRLTEGPVVAEIDRLFELRIAAGKLYAELAVKYGATRSNNYDHNGAFAGFSFTDSPDKDVYRLDKKTRLWVPRKNTPAGKAIWAEIKTLPTPAPIEHAIRLAGLEPGLPMLTDAGRWYAPTMWGYGAPRNIWFISVPWKDVDPEKLSAYKAEKAAGKCFDRDLDALLWEAPAGWTEVKRWEIEKESEEIDAAIEAEVAA
jgi:hypothetical protein